MTLIEWLRVQLDEDEAGFAKGFHRGYCGTRPVAYLAPEMTPCTCGHPAFLLAEVNAKRRILDEVVPKIDEMDSLIESEWGNGLGPVGESEQLIKLLAQPYAGREGWQDEWSAGEAQT